MALTIEELRGFEKVKERLEAAGPSNIRGPHCWFCGKGEPWFTCDCKKAREAQKSRDLGKRDGYPRFNVKLNCIENLETIRFNEELGFKRYVQAPVHALTTSVHAGTPVNSVNTEDPEFDDEDKVKGDREAARKVYRAAWQRERRAKLREVE